MREYSGDDCYSSRRGEERGELGLTWVERMAGRSNGGTAARLRSSALLPPWPSPPAVIFFF